ncbi:cilia- and flagella-associated protein 52 [Patella vulgata]|uniref:cilia- and flagella-associated protein 52 n=1 Tax=Patella vulgata TaxID=6465 RepID=UPI0024A7CDEE|nr:cilia- and flagella-associated protein 52 [Patella vulgata]
MADLREEFNTLKLERIIGFNGSVVGGLKMHPDRKHLIYPLGCNIIIEDISTDCSQRILSKHTDEVTCLAISKSGKYLATGQVTHMGFKATIIIWDYARGEPIHNLPLLHKVKVESLTFSCEDRYLISLGGQDDGSVVVWDTITGEAICGSQAQVKSAGNTYCVCASNSKDDVFVTGGENTLRVWQLDVENRKIRPTDVNLGGLKRIVKCIEMVDEQDPPYFFCGTTTGDILVVNMDSQRLQFVVPEKNKFSLGVTALAFVRISERDEHLNRDGTKTCLPTFEFLVGAGDGELGEYKIKLSVQANKVKATMVHKQNVKPWRDTSFKNKCNSITSIALRGGGHQFFVGSGHSQIYRFNYAEFKCELTKTCHSKQVNDAVFPFGTSELIVTCQDEEIRIWQLSTGKEIRRHVVSNLTCNAVCITRDGSSIYSAWADGKIRAFGFDPKTSNIVDKCVINEAHNKGVTAIACTSDGRCIISGGGEGQVRIWSIQENYDARGKKVYRGVLIETMKEHKGSVSAIKVRDNDKECTSASTDGTCIIWDLEKKVRSQIVFANTLFQCVGYGADACHIVTCGTDRKIGYWETFDGSLIRELDGSLAGAINALDTSPDGKYFVTGGEEKLLKVWRYDEGEVTNVGIGHSAAITKVRICPNQRYIISVGQDGAILVWKFPNY